jgi:two-component system, OmpR family, phosphate regulon sensor histidine kinase PhoR
MQKEETVQRPNDALHALISEHQAKSPASAALERERLLSLINSMADGVIATDERGKIALYNGAALNILDINTVIEGKKIDEVAKVIDKNNQPIDITKLVTSVTTQTSSRDHKISYKDGSISNLYISVAPVRLGFGKSGNKGFVLLLRDITREKSLEEERDEFISVVSHELRTPIAIAEGNIGNAEFIVEKQGGNSQITQALKVAHEQVVFLAGMINDLATLSRAERGVLKVEAEPINAHELIETLAKTYGPDAVKKGLKIKTDLDPHLELLQSSKLYVREVLQNFITNSIKYTEKGTITVGAKPKKGGVLFEVSDTGIGISKADQEKVFDKFFRSEDYRTRANSGTGLGLYVTMKLARLIHAEIELESELNKGSTFSIFIPNYTA